MVWGGATFDAIRRINSMQRGRSGFKRVRLSQKDYREAAEAKEAEEYESFDCFLMCGSCGYLAEPSRDARAFECPACGARSGLDLTHIDVAEELRKADEMSRLHPTPRVAERAQGIATVIGLAAVMTFVFYNQDVFTQGTQVNWVGLLATFMIFGGGGAAMVHKLFANRLHRALHEREDKRPARWRLPLPLVNDRESPIRETRGKVQVEGELLNAPISGRPCVAYELAVLFDVDGDIAKPLWVLEEERCAAIRLGDESFEADSATLILPLEPVAAPTNNPAIERITNYLRRRGLFLPDGNFAFYEALVLPDETYTARLHAGPKGQAWVLGGERAEGYEAGPKTTPATVG
jgi:hypothetical protein